MSNEGKLPKDLTDEDLPPDQWLTVFKVPEKKKTKVFLHMVHDHLYDACRLLYQKVYQAAPSNGELMTKFARGFAYEYCAAAKADPESHKIAWAVVGGMVLENVKSQKGGLNRKVMKFMSDYGVCVAAGQKDFAVDSYGPTASNLPSKQIEIASQPLYTDWVGEIVDELDRQAHKAGEEIASAKSVLAEKRDLWLRNEGSYSACAPIIAEMDRLRADLQGLKASPSDNEGLIVQKEAEIAVLARVLSMGGVLINAANMKEEVSVMQVLNSYISILL